MLSSPVAVVALVLMIVVDVPCLVIAALKGRLVFVLFVGILISFGMVGQYGIALIGPTLPVFSACRLGRPNSFWARRFYDAEKMEESRQRFA